MSGDGADIGESEPGILAERPLTVLGHSDGAVHLLAASGELRSVRARDLEAGREVALLIEGDEAIKSWARAKFCDEEGHFRPSWLGKWLIEEAGRAGVRDPSRLKLRRAGTWREGAHAVAHVGNQVIDADRVPHPLGARDGGELYVADQRTGWPDWPAEAAQGRRFLADLRRVLTFDEGHGADVVLGAVGVALLGEFAAWRPGLIVRGSRGSGKSSLAGVLARLLGPMAGEGVLSGFTEAGLRQARTGRAQTLLLDEFEAAEGDGTRASDILALMRRACGGGGGLTLKGGAGHAGHAFRLVASIFAFAITPPAMTAADQSRMVVLEMKPRRGVDPGVAARHLAALERSAGEIGPALWGRALAEADRFDETVAAFAIRARTLGADARQADTVAAIAAGRDLLTQDGPPDAERMEAAATLMAAILGEDAGAIDGDDGEAALDHLLAQFAAGSPAVQPKPLAEVLRWAVEPDHPREDWRTLGAYGLKPESDGSALYIATAHPQTLRLFAGTRWACGAHAPALAGIEGAERPTEAVRIGGQRFRAIRVPLGDRLTVEEGA